jgi:hypothetical protein
VTELQKFHFSKTKRIQDSRFFSTFSNFKSRSWQTPHFVPEELLMIEQDVDYDAKMVAVEFLGHLEDLEIHNLVAVMTTTPMHLDASLKMAMAANYPW